MGLEVIVIGRNRKSGRNEIIADSNVDYTRQVAEYEKHVEASEEFDRVGIYRLEPVKRIFNPKPKQPTKSKNKNEN